MNMKKRLFLFTVHKAASMLIYRLIKDISHKLNLNFYSINNPRNSYFYFESLPKNENNYSIWENKYGCFAPLRFYLKIPKDVPYRIILHLRDPRDVLVSKFFSDAYSHPDDGSGFHSIEKKLERRKVGIDNYVIKISNEFLITYTKYIKYLLPDKNTIFLKYEEMVFNFDIWLKKVLDSFSIFSPEVNKYYDDLFMKYKDEFKIEREDPKNHKRKIIPGDYKEKLSIETIGILNRKFSQVLNELNYNNVDSL